MSIEAMKQALEAMGLMGADLICEAAHHGKKDRHGIGEPCHIQQRWHKAFDALRNAIAEAEKQEPDVYGYAKRLAEAIWTKHYKAASPQWKPFDDLMGVLTQIDNMTAGLTTPPAAQRPATREEKIVNPGVYEVPGRDGYAAAQRQWVGFTEEEVNEYDYEYRDFIYDIEALLKHKNTRLG